MKSAPSTVEAEADGRDDGRNLMQLVIGDGEHLRCVSRLLRHDHEGRFTIAFDVELDPPYAAECHVQRNAIAVPDEDAPIRHCDDGLDCLCLVVDRFIRLEQAFKV